MKGLGGTLPFHRFTNPRRDKSVYFWSGGVSYLLFILSIKYPLLFYTQFGQFWPSRNELQQER